MKRYINYLTLAGLLISSVSSVSAVEVKLEAKTTKSITEKLVDAKNGIQNFFMTTFPEWVKANPGRSAALATTLVGLYGMYKTCPWFQSFFTKEVKATVNVKQTPKAA